jgi:hypothetical protein
MRKVISLLATPVISEALSAFVSIPVYTLTEYFTGLSSMGLNTFVATAPVSSACWIELDSPGRTTSPYIKAVLTDHRESPLSSTTLYTGESWGSTQTYPYELNMYECVGEDVDDTSPLIGQCRFDLETSTSEIKWVSKGERTTGKDAMELLDTSLNCLGLRYTQLQDQAKTADKTLLSFVKLFEGAEPYYARFGYKLKAVESALYMNNKKASLQNQSLIAYKWASGVLKTEPASSVLEQFNRVPRASSVVTRLTNCFTSSRIDLREPLPIVLFQYKAYNPDLYRALMKDLSMLVSMTLSLSPSRAKVQGVSRRFYLALSVVLHHVYFVKDRSPDSRPSVRLCLFSAELNKPENWTWDNLHQAMKVATLRK